MIWRINSFLGVSRLKITEKLKALFLFDKLRPNYFVVSPTNHFFLSWRLCDLEIIHRVIWRQYLLTAPAAKKDTDHLVSVCRWRSSSQFWCRISAKSDVPSGKGMGIVKFMSIWRAEKLLLKTLFKILIPPRHGLIPVSFPAICSRLHLFHEMSRRTLLFSSVFKIVWWKYYVCCKCTSHVLHVIES